MRIESWTSGWILGSFIAVGACGGGSSSGNGGAGDQTNGNGSGTAFAGSGSGGGGSQSGFTGGTGSSGFGTGQSGIGGQTGGGGSGVGVSSGTGGGDDASAGDDSSAIGDDGGSTTDDGGTTVVTNSDAASDSGCFPSVSDYTAAGTFTPTTDDATAAACTIFRPTTFLTGGCLHPVVVWGNGTFNTPSSYTALFNHFASQGFIIAAANTSNSGSGKEMLACLTYIIAQNTASGSPYAGHVDVNHIASSGYSQGGAGCLEAGEDPRFTTVAAVSPFVEIALGGYDTSSPTKQIHPLFMISGSADTVAVPSANQAPIFSEAKVPICWATHSGSTHFEVLGNGGAYAGPLTAWFRWKLMDDQSARNVFEKPACTLCTQTGWSVQFNSLWM
jgi:hypothetical protein